MGRPQGYRVQLLMHQALSVLSRELVSVEAPKAASELNTLLIPKCLMNRKLLTVLPKANQIQGPALPKVNCKFN